MNTIKFNGRTFLQCSESEFAISEINWANKILSNPSVVWPNGRDSHDVAGEILDRAEDALISYLCLTV